MSTPEPPRPERGASASERGPNMTDLESELRTDKSLTKKLLAAASPKIFFGVARDYPAGIKQFLWLCLGILYPFWLVAILFAWPVIMILKAVGWVLFQIWWFCTGWFWKRLGGEKPDKARRAEIDAEHRAKLDAQETQRYE
ncbi:MAG: hypothetical protein ABIN55_06815 [Aeromicrobium sp.]